MAASRSPGREGRKALSRKETVSPGLKGNETDEHLHMDPSLLQEDEVVEVEESIIRLQFVEEEALAAKQQDVPDVPVEEMESDEEKERRLMKILQLDKNESSNEGDALLETMKSGVR